MDATDLEFEQIKEYHVFKDQGKVVYEKGKVINAPKEYQRIRVHFVFDVKHCGSRQDLWQMDISPKNPIKPSLRNLRLAMFLADCGEQMLGMHISKHSKKKNSILWLILSLKNYKDMFLLFTRHCMVQDLDKHVGMTSILIFFSKWISNLQE